MLTNIFLTLSLLLVTAYVITRLFRLPKNISLLFMAQPLMGSAPPVIVFIGGILSSKLSREPSLATLPLTLMILGVAAASIPAALLAQKKGRKFAIFTGLCCALGAAFLAMFSAIIASFELFSLASLLFGLAAAFTQQLRFAAIESIPNSNDIPNVLALLMLSGVFAAFLGPETAVAAKEWLVAPYDYAGSFLLLAILIIAAMLLMLSFKNPIASQERTCGKVRPLSVITKQPIFLIAVSCATLGYGLMSYLMTATPLSMHHMQGHSLNETKWVIQSHIAAMYLPSLFTPWLIKNIGLKGLLFIGSLIYCLVAFLALSGQQVMHYWWALTLLGIGWNFLFLTGTSLLPQSYQAGERHKVQACNDFILFAFQAMASLLAGWVLFTAGWYWLVLSSLPFIVILFIITWRYHKQSVIKSNELDT